MTELENRMMIGDPQDTYTSAEEDWMTARAREIADEMLLADPIAMARLIESNAEALSPLVKILLDLDLDNQPSVVDFTNAACMFVDKIRAIGRDDFFWRAWEQAEAEY